MVGWAELLGRGCQGDGSPLLGLGVRRYPVIYILDVYIEAYPSLVEKLSRQPPISHCNILIAYQSLP